MIYLLYKIYTMIVLEIVFLQGIHGIFVGIIGFMD